MSAPTQHALYRRVLAAMAVFVAALFLASIAPAAAQTANTLDAIGVSYARAGSTVLRLQLAAPPATLPTYALGNDPPRITIDLSGVANGLKRREVDTGDVVLRSVSVAQEGDRTRLSLKLARPQFVAISVEGSDVLVTLSDKPMVAAVTQPPAAPPPAVAARRPVQEVAPKELPVPPRPERVAEAAPSRPPAPAPSKEERLPAAAPMPASPAPSKEERPPAAAPMPASAPPPGAPAPVVPPAVNPAPAAPLAAAPPPPVPASPSTPAAPAPAAPAPATPAATTPASSASAPAAPPAPPAPSAASSEDKPAFRYGGYYQFEGAYTAPSPGHWSELKNRLEVVASGSFSEDVKWKLGGGIAYDAIYDLSNFYPSAVVSNQSFEAIAREVYVDWSAGDFDLRIGRQQIIWGEVVSLFVADVVSAKDLREFVLPEFDLIRIPQWAVRGEYFKGDFHAEAIWVPVVSVNNVGKPGADFFQYPPAPPPGYAFVINNEVKPNSSFSNSNYGARLSYLKSGWDGAAFYYRSTDIAPTYFRTIVTGANPAYIYDPSHTRIWQAGATLSKDFDSHVVKFESVYTANQNFSSFTPEPANGVIPQNTFNYIMSVDVPLPEETRVNAQFFQRYFTNYNPSIFMTKVQTDVSFLISRPFGIVTPEILLASSVKYKDWMVRPRATITLPESWRLATGLDIFGGIPTGYFGQYKSKSRVWLELRRPF